MESPQQPPPAVRPKFAMSSEAITGTGITVGALGVLALLLGWAQWMRLVRDNAIVWLVLGAILVVAGGITAIIGQSRTRQR